VRQGLLAATILAALTFAAPASSVAAPPPNDNFAAAATLPLGQDVAASNIGSTAEPNEPATTLPDYTAPHCTTAASGPECGRSVWFTFQVPQDGEYTIETCDESNELDTYLAVLTGSTLGSLTEIAANDDGDRELGPVCGGASSGFGSRLTMVATAGTVYRVDVSGFIGDQGYFYIRAYAGGPVARPQPDTGIERNSSYLQARHRGRGVVSGPRRIADFALVSVPPGASFQCSLDGAAYAPCSTPLVYEDLPEGSTHTLLVRATAGGKVDPTPARETFTIDRVPPDTTISGPASPLGSRAGTWVLGSSEHSAPEILQCRLDSLIGVCGPEAKYEGLCDGPHSLSAAAIDGAGNIDPTPAVSPFTVAVGGRPCAAPTVSSTTTSDPAETAATLVVPYDEMGAGGSARIQYGPTPGYGSELEPLAVFPSEPTEKELRPTLHYLDPGTLYHYRVTLTTPFGTADSGDQTLQTKPASGPIPTVVYGAPVPGTHTATLPAQIDPKGLPAAYELLVDTASPVPIGFSGLRGNPRFPAGTVGPQPVSFQLVDLEPSTTYHYRFAVQDTESPYREALGPEGSFTTLPVPPRTAITPRTHFRLRARNVKLQNLTRRSKRLRVTVKGLPGKSVVKVKLFVGGSKQTARKKASKRGKARFKPTLSKRIRKALRKHANKRFRLRVTVSPPADTSSSIALTRRIRR
jgi:hypothetical protein